MKSLIRIFSAVHAAMAALFAILALALVVVATRFGIAALAGDMDRSAAQGLIEAMGILAAAVVALQISQTITEEEVLRDAHVSGPTRVRRFLSRFLVVVVVALSIESLVATFRASHEDPTQLMYAAVMYVGVGVLLAGWGIFIRTNKAAEDLEPEAMREAKSEDEKLR